MNEAAQIVAEQVNGNGDENDDDDRGSEHG